MKKYEYFSRAVMYGITFFVFFLFGFEISLYFPNWEILTIRNKNFISIYNCIYVCNIIRLKF